MSYRLADSLLVGSVRNEIRPDKFEKLVYLVGFIIRIYHAARSPERIIPHVDNSRTTYF